MIKRYRCKRTSKEVAAVQFPNAYAILSEDGYFDSVLTDVFEKDYEKIGVEEELKVKVTKWPHGFVAGEQILVRFKESSPWLKVTFARTEGKAFIGSHRIYKGEQWVSYGYAIPYEGNEHLEGKITICSSGRWPTNYEFPKPEHEFKPFDRVVTRTGAGSQWSANIFSHIYMGGFICSNHYFEQCLPYNEKTAKLIGTTDDWEG